MKNPFKKLLLNHQDEATNNQMALTLERLTKTDVAQILTPNHSLAILHSQTPIAEAIAKTITKTTSFVVVSDKKTDELLGIATLAEMGVKMGAKIATQTTNQPSSSSTHPPSKSSTPNSVPHSEKVACLADVMEKPLLVPESQSLMELFSHMYGSHKRVAFVVDEMGQIIGALELEQIIAFAIEATATTHSNSQINENEDGSLAVGAATPLVEIAKQYGSIASKAEQKQCDTIGGLVALTAGHLPSRGEVVRHKSGVEFTVEEIIGRRITKVRISFPPK